MSNVVQLFSRQVAEGRPQRWSMEQSAQMYADAHRMIDGGMPEIVVDTAAAASDRPLAQAVANYRAAWQAFQEAPEGPESSLAEEAEPRPSGRC